MFNQIKRLDCLIGYAVYSIFRLFGVLSKRKNRIFPAEVKKILCIKLWGLGNLSIIYPLLYRIKGEIPHAKLSFITFDLNRGFLERNQAIDRIVYFKFTQNPFFIAWQFICLIIKFKKEGVDLLINFETFNHVSAFFSYLTGACVRIGLYNKYEKIFYNYPIYAEKFTHISQLFSNLIKPLGIDSAYRYFRYQGLKEEKDKVGLLLSNLKIKKFICFHVGTSENFKGKRYKTETFAKLADLLIDKFNLPIIFTGIASEKELIRNIAKMATFQDKIFDLSGKLTLWEFVELLRKVILFISPDTGPAHIAASLNVNLAVFYGPTSPERYRPLNVNNLVFYKNMSCSPCVGVDYINKKCPNKLSCLDFTPQEVFSMVSERFLYVTPLQEATGLNPAFVVRVG